MPLLLRRLLAPLLLALTLPACATITTGTTSTISVMTDPPGAACTLRRQGDVVGVVNPTPGSVTVSKSMHSIDVQCARAGYGPGMGAISSQFQAMTVGNILIGGLVGVVVDAASGAAGTYPGSVTIAMPREGAGGAAAAATAALGTPSAAADDPSVRIAEVQRNYEERIAAARGACSPANMRHCEQSITALERARDAELLEMRQLGQAARTGA